MKVNKLDISKKIIKSPVKINSLSKDLKNKLKKEPGVSPGQNHSFKKIKISPKKIKSKQNHLFIPTSLSNKPIEDTNDVVVDKLIETINPSDTPVTNSRVNKPSVLKKPDEIVKQDFNRIDMKKNVKKLSKSKKVSRKKKSTKNKTISINLNNTKVEKEKDIIEIINKFEKMNIKEIKDFLKNKGIDTKNNNKSKSKLLPYLYLLTCVDNDINIIKN